MKFLTILFLALILLFGLSCDNITEPAEILSTTEQYTRILSRDGFWMYDTTYTDRYIQFEDSLYLGYTKMWRLYYLPNGIYYHTVTYKSIDGEILLEAYVRHPQYQYQWRIIEIEENEKWGIEYNRKYVRPIASLNKKKLVFQGSNTYDYVSNE